MSQNSTTATPDATTHELVPTESIEGFKGIIMAFMMALVFRAFIVEGFEIPTGSMAPTLMGQHTLMHAGPSGHTWPVGPGPGAAGAKQSYSTSDPMTRGEARALELPVRGGDRVFILKYLFPLYTPSRYDVVVFKNPCDPAMNYIKRLIGLGPEEIALIDGDVFSRPISADGKPEPTTTNTWTLPGWVIDRKPESAQRAMWQAVFDTRYTPLNPSKDGRTWFRSPWVAEESTSKSWKIEGTSEYRFEGTGSTSLQWDLKRRAIDDSYPYNDRGGTKLTNGWFPVSDVRTTVDITPQTALKTLSFVLATRKHEFRASIEGTAVSLRMRGAEGSPWTELGKGTLPKALEAGKSSMIEFWHADQTLRVFVNGTEVATGPYDWTPNERLINTMGLTADQVFTSPTNVLIDNASITQPKVKLEFDGSTFTLHRLSLDRDIHYQPADYAPRNEQFGPPNLRANQPAAATHPRQPTYLSDGEYFMCGDNSPASLDARLWDRPYPWVAQEDPKLGVVTRDALIGRAFIVYWPGMYWTSFRMPVPDFGRVRQIR